MKPDEAGCNTRSRAPRPGADKEEAAVVVEEDKADLAALGSAMPN